MSDPSIQDRGKSLANIWSARISSFKTVSGEVIEGDSNEET